MKQRQRLVLGGSRLSQTQRRSDAARRRQAEPGGQDEGEEFQQIETRRVLAA